MKIDETELEKLKEKVRNQQGARALASPLYFIVQQIALLLSINFIFPKVLELSWNGDYLVQAIFVFLYAIVYSIFGLLFLAVSAFFAIMLEGVKIMNDIKTGKISLQAAAQTIPFKVMTGEHPKWLISLAPPLVPMMSLSFLSIFFQKNIALGSPELLMKACAVQGVVSYFLSLPFILKAQKALHEAVSLEE